MEAARLKLPIGRFTKGWGRASPGGYILLEMVIGLVLLGVLLPFWGQFYQVYQRFFQTLATENAALQVRHYIQFVLREDMKNTTAVTEINGEVVVTTVLGDAVYIREGEILKRRFSGQTIRLNPDLDLRVLAIHGTSSPMSVRLETNYGIVEIHRGF
jgi:type II secretory pathway pseudopilin PulG